VLTRPWLKTQVSSSNGLRYNKSDLKMFGGD
jgi:hypothetical protein